MTVYWVMFLMPALAVFAPSADKATKRSLWIAIWLMFTLLVGLRHEVGADWAPYLIMYEDIMVAGSFSEAFARSDSAYVVINWCADKLGLDIYGVNVVCAAIFMAGVVAFAKRQPLPWLAFAVAIPYLVIIVGMGYTRQSAALGFFFLALIELESGRIWRFFGWIVFGALFHKSLIFLALFGVKETRLGGLARFLLILPILLLSGYALLAEHYEMLWARYTDPQISSSGGSIRVAMNACAAMAFIAVFTRWRRKWGGVKIWGLMSAMALACVPLVGLVSTAVDRMALYFLPLQIIVFSRLPALMDDKRERAFGAVMVLVFYAVVLWVWLNWADMAFAWLPYQNILWR